MERLVGGNVMCTSLCLRLKGILLIGLMALAASCENRGPMSSSTPATSAQNQMKGHEEAARKALETLPGLVNAENFTAMGFTSVEEARSATLGTPVPLRTVSYNKLLQYQPGAPLTQLFEGPEQFVYPVMVGQAVRTSIVVAQQPDGWRIGTVGDRYLASLIGQSTQQPGAPTAAASPTASPTPAASPTATATPTSEAVSRRVELISIPGIGVDLISFTEGDQRMLQPANDLPEAQLVRGRAVREQDALAALSNYAREFDRKYGEEIRKRRLVK